VTERIILERGRPHPIRGAGLIAFGLGLLLYLGVGSTSGGATLATLTLSGLGLGLFLLDRSQSEGVVLDARGLHDRWGTIAWKDVIDIQRSTAGTKTFLTLTLPRADYASRVHPRDEGPPASHTRWSVEISGRDMAPEAIEAAARDWQSKAVGAKGTQPLSG